MNIENYKRFFTAEYLMGPNSLRILDEIMTLCPLKHGDDGLILDLGCGTGITSFYLCRETGAKILANDLWISTEDNSARFDALGVGDRITPILADARELGVEENRYDAVVSIDSYHYFAGVPGYFASNILPCIKPGGMALIAIPGIKDEYDGRTMELLSPWLGDEASLFKSPRQWREIIGSHPDIESVDISELGCFEQAWSDWLSIDNEYARGDAQHFESIIRPCSNLIAIVIKKRQG